MTVPTTPSYVAVTPALAPVDVYFTTFSDNPTRTLPSDKTDTVFAAVVLGVYVVSTCPAL